MPARSRLRSLAETLATALDHATRIASWLVLPLALLLFAQWPLRELAGAWSRQANDAAQWLFALYVALALRATTRQRGHMAAGLPAESSRRPWRQRLARCGEAICVLPWAAFVVVTATPSTWRSLLSLEAFPETYNPLYFVIRGAAWLLAFLVMLQATLDLALGRAPAPTGSAP